MQGKLQDTQEFDKLKKNEPGKQEKQFVALRRQVEHWL